MNSEPIRVLHVLGNLNRGGAETFVMNVYRAIDKTKIQFDFIVHTDMECDFSNEVINMGGRIYNCSKYVGKNHISYVRWWKQFFKTHQEYKVIHSHVRSTASIFLSIAKREGLATIIHSHSISNGKGLISTVKRILQVPLRWNADYFFGCSKEAGEWLFGKRIVNSSKYYHIPNAVDTNKFFYDSSVRESYRNEFGISDKVVYIHVGRFNEPKNHKFLIDIFEEIKKVQPNSVLMLVGAGELFDEIKERIVNQGLYDSVLMLGKRSDVSELYSAADCLLFPSLWEGLPVTLIEAQANGIPCFISDTISNDVKISDLIHMLPINKGTQPWVEAISNSLLQRKDVSQQLSDSGYNIISLTRWLQNFYIKCIKN